MIKYIAFYDVNSNEEENRNVPPAAKTKLDYIISTLCSFEKKIEIISPAVTTSKNTFKGKKINLSEKCDLKLFLTFGKNKLVFTKVGTLITKILFMIYLFINVKKDDDVIVYHSLYYMRFIKILRKLKRFNLILEIEEIYSDVLNDEVRKKKEQAFFKCANSYIFPTILLNSEVNVNNKPYVIIHGTYRVEPDYNCRFNDGKTHIVYAGTFDPRKGGAVAAVDAAEFLDENYHIHVIGFGSDIEIKYLKEEFVRVSNKTKCVVSYDGLKHGDEYIRFIQSCDIGLSTQNPDAAFNATSFPSKILSYLSNGLRVVSIRIPAIEGSDVGDKLFYYDEQTPKQIADAILSVDMAQAYDSRSDIVDLSNKFQNELMLMMKDY